ncbi:YhbY family RNA-binding protein [Halioxenophilus sp. WMMB6]|uniref:YhbY family RNA-binding protein n=1 Tax=Halioxenophilus sp. WMMB6 TaxID=3073815 RepID=UPI00295EB5D4|nr:YhbY family RNA-binding protein [Halioxenophilus sp. WMMB6]
MSVSADNRKLYRAIGHKLKPCVTIAGNGLSEGVVDELFRALRDHELIKVKLAIAERDERKALIENITAETGAEVIQEIGKVVLLFKKAGKPNPKLTNLRFAL